MTFLSITLLSWPLYRLSFSTITDYESRSRLTHVVPLKASNLSTDQKLVQAGMIVEDNNSREEC